MSAPKSFKIKIWMSSDTQTHSYIYLILTESSILSSLSGPSFLPTWQLSVLEMLKVKSKNIDVFLGMCTYLSRKLPAFVAHDWDPGFG